MQILTLRIGQRVRIGADIIVVVVGVDRGSAKLKIIAPDGERIETTPRILRNGDRASLEPEPDPPSPPH